MKFAAHILSVLGLISAWGVAQSAPVFSAAPVFNTKIQSQEIALQRYVRGFVYCPDGRVGSVEMSLRSHITFSTQISHVHTDKTGYFDFGDVPVGKYELVVKNRCSATTTSVNKFEVTVQSGATGWFKGCSPPEEVVIRLKKQSNPEIFSGANKTANCG